MSIANSVTFLAVTAPLVPWQPAPTHTNHHVPCDVKLWSPVDMWKT
jgi:hypothetical protein